MVDTVEQAIANAIRQGAPLYNQGRPDKCFELYRATALSLVDSPTVSDAARSHLRAAVERTTDCNSVDEGAWVMRRAFDSILDGSVEMQARLLQLPPGTTEYTLLDFEQGLPPVPRWAVVDDDVMGGVSSSSISWDAGDSAAIFSGNVTTANNGGFASVRSQAWSGWCFNNAKGVRLMVKGDGRQYKLNAKEDDAYDGVQYQRDFPTVANQWQVVDLPFETFKPNFRGRMVPGRPLLRGQNIRQIGFMVSKFSDAGGTTQNFTSGRFRLALKWVKGFL